MAWLANHSFSLLALISCSVWGMGTKRSLGVVLALSPQLSRSPLQITAKITHRFLSAFWLSATTGIDGSWIGLLLVNEDCFISKFDTFTALPRLHIQTLMSKSYSMHICDCECEHFKVQYYASSNLCIVALALGNVSEHV